MQLRGDDQVPQKGEVAEVKAVVGRAESQK